MNEYHTSEPIASKYPINVPFAKNINETTEKIVNRMYDNSIFNFAAVIVDINTAIKTKIELKTISIVLHCFNSRNILFKSFISNPHKLFYLKWFTKYIYIINIKISQLAKAHTMLKSI